jgi:hypothetical protein
MKSKFIRKPQDILDDMLKVESFQMQEKWNPNLWGDLEYHFPEIKHIKRPENCLMWLKNNKPQYFI